MLGTLDFTGLKYRAPFSFSQNTALLGKETVVIHSWWGWGKESLILKVIFPTSLHETVNADSDCTPLFFTSIGYQIFLTRGIHTSMTQGKALLLTLNVALTFLRSAVRRVALSCSCKFEKKNSNNSLTLLCKYQEKNDKKMETKLTSKRKKPQLKF